MKIESLENIANYILEITKGKNIRYESPWLSGSSTYVYPVEYGYDQYRDENKIIIQLSILNPYWYANVRTLLAKLKYKFKHFTFNKTINKYDGSRPYELELTISEVK